MKLLRTLARMVFGSGPARPMAPSAPAVLRNKPGGFAWINSGADEGNGSHVLVNRVVRTVRLAHSNLWLIEPVQIYRIERPTFFLLTGQSASAGQIVFVNGLTDHCLTPIPGDLVSEEEVAGLFAPTLPLRGEVKAS